MDCLSPSSSTLVKTFALSGTLTQGDAQHKQPLGIPWEGVDRWGKKGLHANFISEPLALFQVPGASKPLLGITYVTASLNLTCQIQAICAKSPFNNTVSFHSNET